MSTRKYITHISNGKNFHRTLSIRFSNEKIKINTKRLIKVGPHLQSIVGLSITRYLRLLRRRAFATSYKCIRKVPFPPGFGFHGRSRVDRSGADAKMHVHVRIWLILGNWWCDGRFLFWLSWFEKYGILWCVWRCFVDQLDDCYNGLCNFDVA